MKRWIGAVIALIAFIVVAAAGGLIWWWASQETADPPPVERPSTVRRDIAIPRAARSPRSPLSPRPGRGVDDPQSYTREELRRDPTRAAIPREELIRRIRKTGTGQRNEETRRVNENP
jgi:hypothetical protein